MWVAEHATPDTGQRISTDCSSHTFTAEGRRAQGHRGCTREQSEQPGESRFVVTRGRGAPWISEEDVIGLFE